MVPREKMAALELTTPEAKVLDAARTGAHTRMPVYEGELDKIVGIVNTKNLFYLFSFGRGGAGGCTVPGPFLKPRRKRGQCLAAFPQSAQADGDHA